MGLILLITYDDGPSIWWKETDIGKQKTLVTGAQPSAKKLLESITMMNNRGSVKENQIWVVHGTKLSKTRYLEV